MKSSFWLLLANLSTLVVSSFLCFGAFYLINTCICSLRTLVNLFLLVIVFPLLPSFIKYLCFIPGGFAWRNHHYHHQNYPASDDHAKHHRGPICWPILGLLPQIMGSHHAHRKLASLATALGSTRLMPFTLGPNTRLIISSHPDTAREILCGSSFSDRPIKESARTLMFQRAIGFAPSGKYWRHLRRIAANHMFSPKRVANLEGLRQRVADEMIASVVLRGGGVDHHDHIAVADQVVQLRSILKRGSLINVLESVFGSNININLGYNNSSESGEKLRLMVEEGYELISEFNWADYIPLRWLDFGGVRKRCHKLAGEVNCLIGGIIKERRRELQVAAAGNHHANNNMIILRNDFLSACLALPEEDQLIDADLVAVLWEMVFRGTDTVAILLEWIMARMVLHQDIQAKAQQEIDTCVGHARHVQDSDIPYLPYLGAIVKEVLRMHPPGPLLSWARLATQDVQVDKLFIPAGTTAMVNMWAITHDPSIWKDPWTFRPERFIEEDVSIMGSDLRLAPFGSGRRVCPGRMLGLTTVQLWLARLLQEFKWLPKSPSMSPNQVDLSERLNLSLEMKYPLACCAINRVRLARD